MAGDLDRLQRAVWIWLIDCMGTGIALSLPERGMRLTEESLEYAQAVGVSKAEALAIVEQVYAKPGGEPEKEIGDVLICLCAAAERHGESLLDAGQTTLAANRLNIDYIRAKHQDKVRST